MDIIKFKNMSIMSAFAEWFHSLSVMSWNNLSHLTLSLWIERILSKINKDWWLYCGRFDAVVSLITLFPHNYNNKLYCFLFQRIVSFGRTGPDFNFIFPRFNWLALSHVCWPDIWFSWLSKPCSLQLKQTKPPHVTQTACPPLAFPQSIWHQIYQSIHHQQLSSPAVMASALENLCNNFGVTNFMDMLSENHCIANNQYRKRSLWEMDYVWQNYRHQTCHISTTLVTLRRRRKLASSPFLD